jgi:hypothetical protein
MFDHLSSGSGEPVNNDLKTVVVFSPACCSEAFTTDEFNSGSASLLRLLEVQGCMFPRSGRGGTGDDGSDCGKCEYVQMPGFISPEALLHGVEVRASAIWIGIVSLSICLSFAPAMPTKTHCPAKSVPTQAVAAMKACFYRSSQQASRHITPGPLAWSDATSDAPMITFSESGFQFKGLDIQTVLAVSLICHLPWFDFPFNFVAT